MMTTQQQTEQSDHDGLCPVCHKTDGYFDIVRAHWFFCREHRMAWWVGTNLYGILPEDLEEQRRYAEEFVGYQCVEPFYFPETLARAGVTVSTATKGEPTMITAEAICKAYEALLDRRATWFLCDELLKAAAAAHPMWHGPDADGYWLVDDGAPENVALIEWFRQTHPREAKAIEKT